MIRYHLIGNPSAYIEYVGKKINNRYIGWLTKYERFTIALIKRHVKGELTLGTLPIFYKSHALYSRFVAIDIDMHVDDKKNKQYGIDYDLKGRAFKKLAKLYAQAELYLNVPKESTFIEDSGGGFHVWIIIAQPFTLQNANVYINFIKPRVQKLFLNIDDSLEFFPKQDKKDMEIIKNGEVIPFNLAKKPGTGIKLPFGFNKKRGLWSKIIFGDPINIIPANLTDLCRDLRHMFSVQKILKITHHDPQPFDIRQEVLDEDIKYFYKHPEIRPCFKAVMDGSFQATGSNGNIMRVGLANELYNHKAPISAIIKAFENQKDFDYETTKYHVEQCISSVNSKGTPLTLRHKTIQQLGFCLPDCYYLGNSTRKWKDMTKKYDSVDGWKGLHGMNDTIVQKKGKRYYYYKTTRSGTTTSVIIQALKHKKKILMIAPLINIFKITVKEAIITGKKLGYLKRYDKFFTYRIKSNLEVCSKINKKYGKIDGIINVFPFFYKNNCKKCTTKIKDSCEYQTFLRDIDTFDLIYLTVKKFNALIKGGDQAKIMLNKLLSWSDIIFVDECSHIFDVEWDSIQIYEESYDYSQNEIQKWTKSLNLFLIKYPNFISKTHVVLLEQFIQKISLELNKILKNNESLFISFKNNCYDQLEIKGNIELYQQFIKYFKETGDPTIKSLVDCFLLMNRPQIYLQLILPSKNPKKVFLASVSDIMNMVKYLDTRTHDKLLLLTDATEPPIRLDKCFMNLDYLYVNDPMNTAIKQVVYCLPFKLNIRILNDELKEKIIDIMNKYATNPKKPVFVVAQSIRIMTYLLNLIRETRNFEVKWQIGKTDYFRGKHTKGQPSKLRRMIVFGSANPPRHCYDYIAQIYRKAGFLTEHPTTEIAGRYLEQYSAQSAFFQAISRVKCPEGKVDSDVFVFGVNFNTIKLWLNMKINTPRVIQL